MENLKELQVTECGLLFSAMTTITTHARNVPLKLGKSAQGNQKLRKSPVFVAGLSRFSLYEEEAQQRDRSTFTLSPLIKEMLVEAGKTCLLIFNEDRFRMWRHPNKITWEAAA